MAEFQWNVCLTSDTEVCRFAAEEFVRLMRIMDPNTPVALTASATSPTGSVLLIGIGPAFPIPAVDDPLLDDAISIQVEQGSGVITGSNPRSVLIAVYRFFREAGCVFLHPGRHGEYIPIQNSYDLTVRVFEAAAYRHRGICLEGANSYENVADMVDFAPKLGFNEYFTQLFRPGFAFRRWYEHQNNPTLPASTVSDETIDRFVKKYDREIALRGLHHHRIGHGWASKIIGFTSSAWHEINEESQIIPGREKLIAWINGKQHLFHGSGIDTNLCYSNPQVQALLVDEVVAFAAANPDITYLHFWLADTVNNQCECSNCGASRPSDLYVDILNQIDKALEDAGLPVKIVFLIYLDLLWEPEKSRLRYPDRFVLMYAPIRRSYSVPLASDSGRDYQPYVRNGFIPQPEAGATLPYLRAWQKQFPGDSFIFDYHYMWDYIHDPGCYESIRIMAQDVEDYSKLGLCGLMSCQNQRVFMPNGFGMNAMGNSLWCGKNLFWETAKDYFPAAYGPDGEKCFTLMDTISSILDPMVLRGEKPVRDARIADACAKLLDIIENFAPVITHNTLNTDGIQKHSWMCFAFYAELCKKLAMLLRAAALGLCNEVDDQWADIRSYVCSNELKYQTEFDVFEFINVWENKILPRFRQQQEILFE